MDGDAWMQSNCEVYEFIIHFRFWYMFKIFSLGVLSWNYKCIICWTKKNAKKSNANEIRSLAVYMSLCVYVTNAINPYGIR